MAILFNIRRQHKDYPFDFSLDSSFEEPSVDKNLEFTKFLHLDQVEWRARPNNEMEEEDMLEDVNMEENRRLENQQEIDWDQREQLKASSLLVENSIDNMVRQIKSKNFNCWSLPKWYGSVIFAHLLSKNFNEIPITQFESAVRSHNKHDESMQEYEENNDLEILKHADVVGMTLTGSAKYSRLLDGLESEIIIIEEAAETLEAQNLSIFTKHLKHLILIGDHKQLRPKCFNYHLEKNFNMNISLFERLINNNIEYVTLQQQRRMRPEIADFVRNVIYSGEYTDHMSVEEYENVRGLKKNVFFINHSHLEEGIENNSSTFNLYEVSYLISLAVFLVSQGYEPKEITILTFYMGQLFKLRREAENESSLKGINIVVVDNYQGEENEIILLSLVRSNKIGKLGFIKEPNRVCVALSRAKIGMYVIGNFNFLSEHDRIWRKIEDVAREKDCIGDKLVLFCEIHKKEAVIKEPTDFDSRKIGGVCQEICNTRKSCGHLCQLLCHRFDHNKFYCEEFIDHLLECGHVIRKKCSEQDPICRKKVIRILPCNHQVVLECSAPNPKCEEECNKIFECGHKCVKKCWVNCERYGCFEKVYKTLPCGHEAEVLCREDEVIMKKKTKCEKKCNTQLPCGHYCIGTCFTCLEGTVHLPCLNKVKKKLICGHEKLSKCSNPKICLVANCSDKSESLVQLSSGLIRKIKEIIEKFAEEKSKFYLDIENKLKIDLTRLKNKNLTSHYKLIVQAFNSTNVFPHYTRMLQAIRSPSVSSDLEIKFEKHLERVWNLLSKENKYINKFTLQQIIEKLICLDLFLSRNKKEEHLALFSVNKSFAFEKSPGFNYLSKVDESLEINSLQTQFVNDETWEIEIKEDFKQPQIQQISPLNLNEEAGEISQFSNIIKTERIQKLETDEPQLCENINEKTKKYERIEKGTAEKDPDFYTAKSDDDEEEKWELSKKQNVQIEKPAKFFEIGNGGNQRSKLNNTQNIRKGDFSETNNEKSKIVHEEQSGGEEEWKPSKFFKQERNFDLNNFSQNGIERSNPEKLREKRKPSNFEKKDEGSDKNIKFFKDTTTDLVKPQEEYKKKLFFNKNKTQGINTMSYPTQSRETEVRTNNNESPFVFDKDIKLREKVKLEDITKESQGQEYESKFLDSSRRSLAAARKPVRRRPAHNTKGPEPEQNTKEKSLQYGDPYKSYDEFKLSEYAQIDIERANSYVTQQKFDIKEYLEKLRRR